MAFPFRVAARRKLSTGEFMSRFVALQLLAAVSLWLGFGAQRVEVWTITGVGICIALSSIAFVWESMRSFLQNDEKRVSEGDPRVG